MDIKSKLKSIFAKTTDKKALECSILEYYGIESEKDIDAIIRGKDIHSTVDLCDLLVSEGVVIGLNGKAAASKTLYYVGINDAIPNAMFDSLVIYDDSLPEGAWDKIERYIKG